MYTVSWSPSAERELVEIWNKALDRDEVTAASNEIDAALARAPSPSGRQEVVARELCS